MSWTKHFQKINVGGTAGSSLAYGEGRNHNESSGTSSKYASYLPEVYAGHPNRIQRYYQYSEMDLDSDITAAMDLIADFCTQSEEQNDEPFRIVYNDEATEPEVKLINTSLKLWTKTNEFKKRLWTIFRQTIMNGDQFFLRDPETGEWLWIDHFNVEMVKVDDTKGKEPEEYIIRGLDLNRQAKFATRQADPSQYRTPFGGGLVPGSRPPPAPGSGVSQGSNVFQMAGQNRDVRSQASMQANELSVISAEHVIHLSLSVGMDVNWPFGKSILEPVFKTYKQKELLEDSIIIYRVQRAPERRIFYIDVGTMPPMRAKAHIEQIKNEIHQRRIPNRTGGGSSIIDAAYNPMSIVEDYFFAQSSDGKGSRVDTLPGGDNLGEIGDLSYFNKKLARGLKIPTSYMNLGDDDGQGASYNDGKLGAAVIQEFKFNKYCMRLQALLAPTFDKDFKRYLKESGVEIEPSLFELAFNPPQNFTKYRDMEIKAQQANIYSQVAGIKFLSERYKLIEWLGMTEDQLLENERMWKEENPAKAKKATGASPAESVPDGGLGDIGIRPGEGDFGDDLADLGGDELGGDAGAPAADAGAGAGAGGAVPPPPPPGGGPAL